MRRSLGVKRGGCWLGWCLAVTCAAPSSASRSFFATCHRGLEPVLVKELLSEKIGATRAVPGNAGVWFDGESTIGMKALIWLRSANRVLELIASNGGGAAPGRHFLTKETLYDFVRDCTRWEELIGADACGVPHMEDVTISVEATLGSVDRSLTNAHFTALTAKNAICDALRDVHGGLRPSVDVTAPHVPIRLHVHEDRALIFRSLSAPASMHKRGYREVCHVAVLRENLAAGLLMLAGLGPDAHLEDTVLCDPMCGSGTFAIEAALMATNTAPGLIRYGGLGGRGEVVPPLCNFPGYDRSAWVTLLRAAERRRRPTSMRILINDRHEGAVSLAQSSLQRLGLERMVSVTCGDVSCFRPRLQPTLVVVNPPWDRRLSDGDGSSAAWEDLGRFLKGSAGAEGLDAWVLSGNKELTRHLRMRKTRQVAVQQGEMDLRWINYNVFKPKREWLDESGRRVFESEGMGSRSTRGSPARARARGPPRS